MNRAGQSYQRYDTKLMMGLSESVNAVRGNRFVQPFVAKELKVYASGPTRQKAAVAKAVRWSLHTSIWAPRATWCDAKDFWDTTDALRGRFTNLWRRCLDLGLAELVVKMDDGDGADSDSNGSEKEASLFGEDGDTRDDHPEVQDVKRVMWEHHELTESLFAYYACVEPSSLNQWGMIEWTLFLGDLGIVSKKSKFCKTSDLDLIFIAIDAKATRVHRKMLEDSKRKLQAHKKETRLQGARGGVSGRLNGKESGVSTAGEDAQASMPPPPPTISTQRASSPTGATSPGIDANAQQRASSMPRHVLTQREISEIEKHGDVVKALMMDEFMLALLQIAINKYVACGKLPDVSEALQRFFVRDLKPHARRIPGLLMQPNDFLKFAYVEEVDAVLRRHEATLRVLFEVGSADSGGGASAKRQSKLMNMQEWLEMLRALEICGHEMSDISERDATLCFCLSRMCVIDPRSESGRIKESGLPFEGFLECLCRLANLTALPTDEELASAGYKDAGRFLREGCDEEARKDLISRRSRSWGEEPSTLVQPLCRCVDHLIAVMVRSVQDDTTRKKNDRLELTRKEVERWAKNHLDDDEA